MIRVDAAWDNGLRDQNWLGVYKLRHNNALIMTKLNSATTTKTSDSSELKSFSKKQCISFKSAKSR